jgi:hypothetical protein
MKAPQNFAEKIKGHRLFVNGMFYELGDSSGANNIVWIYPKNKSANVICIEFNWEKQYYEVKIVKSGAGRNFHTILPAFDFVRTSHFLSFGAFNSWMVAKIEDLHKYFEFQ